MLPLKQFPKQEESKAVPVSHFTSKGKVKPQNELNSKIKFKTIEGIVSLSKAQTNRLPLQPLQIAADNLEEAKSSQRPSRKRNLMSPSDDSSFSVGTKKRKLDTLPYKVDSEPMSQQTAEERRRELVS